MGKPNRLMMLACAAALFASTSAFAAISAVGTRPGLAPNDSIDWVQLGPAFTPVPNGSTALSLGGITATLTGPADPMERRDQSFGGWAGNFAPGDALLWTNDADGPLTIEFDVPVFGAGAQIQRDAYGDFQALIEAYDGGGGLLGSFLALGTSNGDGDNSAIFLGVLSDVANIKKIVYDVDGGTQDFAINLLSLKTEGGVPPQPHPSIPEPGTLSLLSLGVVSVLRRRRR